MAEAKLSRLQKQILLDLLQFIRRHEKRGQDFPETVRHRRETGAALLVSE